MSTLKVGEIKHENFTGTTQLKLDNSGNIGLGTSTPTSPDGSNADNSLNGPTLTIYGDSPAINLTSSTTGASDYSLINFGRTGSTSNPYRAVIGYKQSDDILRINAQNHIAFDAGGGINASEIMRIDGSGKVGIGTTSPDTILEVTDGGTEPRLVRIHNSSTNGSAIQFTNTDTGNSTNQGYFVGLGASGEANVWHQSNFNLLFGTNNIERMRITSSGQLLIGTTSTSGVSASSDDIVIGSIGDSTYRGITFATTSEAAIRWADAGDNAMGRIEYSNSNDKMTLHTSNAERIRIGSSGFVGIGQGSSYDPGAPLEVRNPAGTTPSSGVLNLLRLCAQHNSARGLDIGTGRPTSGNQNDGGVFYNARDTESSGYSAQHVFQRAGNNVMVIGYAGGNTVGIGTDYPLYKIDCHHSGANQSNAAVSRFRQLTNNQGQDHACIIVRHAAARSGQNGVGLIFQNDGGSNVGRIDIGQSTTGYETSSDYRLKENVEAISDGITRLKTLKPYRFNWIAEKGQPKVDGFFAHEVTSAVPEAIRGTKDEVETTYYEKGDTIPDGKAVGDVKSTTSPVYQGIDQSKLVPLLTAALQEEVAKREALEARVAALEGA